MANEIPLSKAIKNQDFVIGAVQGSDGQWIQRTGNLGDALAAAGVSATSIIYEKREPVNVCELHEELIPDIEFQPDPPVKRKFPFDPDL